MLQLNTETTAKPEEPKDHEPKCLCKCYMLKQFKVQNMTEEERNRRLQEKIKLIQADMNLPRRNVSSIIRTKTSAQDMRLSAQGIGYFSSALLAGVGGLMILLDATSLLRDFRTLLQNIRNFIDRDQA